MSKIKGFVFIEIILVTAILLFLSFYLLKGHFKNNTLDPQTRNALSEQGIDTANYGTTVNSVRDKVHDITTQRMNELDSIK